MLTPRQIAQIARLIEEGESQRSISIALGIARETVRQALRRRRKNRVWRGGSDSHEAMRPQQRQAGGAEIAQPTASSLDDASLYDVKHPIFTGAPQRCVKCGATCYMPCLACRLKRRAQRPRGPE